MHLLLPENQPNRMVITSRQAWRHMPQLLLGNQQNWATRDIDSTMKGEHQGEDMMMTMMIYIWIADLCHAQQAFPSVEVGMRMATTTMTESPDFEREAGLVVPDR